MKRVFQALVTSLLFGLGLWFHHTGDFLDYYLYMAGTLFCIIEIIDSIIQHYVSHKKCDHTDLIDAAANITIGWDFGYSDPTQWSKKHDKEFIKLSPGRVKTNVVRLSQSPKRKLRTKSHESKKARTI